MFALRATQLRTVGVHHYGLACNLVKDVSGSPSWKGDFKFLGKLAKKYQLIWGGDWGKPKVRTRFPDNVHLQRCAVKDQKNCSPAPGIHPMTTTPTNRSSGIRRNAFCG
jgi:hypothetical protein